MSQTNAIHGIVLLGGLIVIGLADDTLGGYVIGVIAITFGTINVVGGFLVTDRMLEMFKPQAASPPKRSSAAAEERRPSDRHELRRTSPGLRCPTVLYIVSFALFIFGSARLTASDAPPSAATDRRRRHGASPSSRPCLTTDIGNWGLIIAAALRSATAVGHPRGAQREDDRDATDGRAVQRRGRRRCGADRAGPSSATTERRRASRSTSSSRSSFSAIVGSISFWGSNIAFAKLQELMPGPADLLPGQQLINGLLLAASSPIAMSVAICDHGSQRRDALHRDPDRCGPARQLRRPADRRRGHAGRHLAAQRVHRAVPQRRPGSRSTTPP